MSETEHLDHEALAELQEVMEDEFDILVNTYLSDSKVRIETLAHALADQDSDAFAKAAHSFKGSCINIGALQLGDLCFTAEKAGKEGDLSDGQAMLEAINAEFRTVSRQLRDYLTD
ncbi:Hpt domain-containing protein [Marinobacteraceae bacterium S3BR75-40.1]